MGKLILLALSLNFCICLRAQTLSFEAGYGLHNYSMQILNELYINYYNSSYDMKPITLGQNVHAAIKYKPHALYEVGIVGNFQQGKSRGNYINPWYYPSFGNNFQEITVQALGISISNTLYLSHWMKFQEKGKFLQRSHAGIEISGGVAFCNMRDERVSHLFGNTSGSWDNSYTSRRFQGQAALKFQYNYIQNPLVAAVGLKIGYQYLVSENMHGGSNETIYFEKFPKSLDFSGVFTTVFLTVGK